ncbi:MAG: Mor transcription activator family protein [Burkholderiaceae bacterium]
MNKPATALDLAPVNAVIDPACPPTLREITEHLYLELAEAEPAKPSGERAHELAQLAWRQLERLCAAMGGMNWYLNKGVALRLSKRNRAMCAKFRGDYKVLAREYQLTEQQVRTIVDAWQKEEFAKRQSALFEGGAAAKKPSRQK